MLYNRVFDDYILEIWFFEPMGTLCCLSMIVKKDIKVLNIFCLRKYNSRSTNQSYLMTFYLGKFFKKKKNTIFWKCDKMTFIHYFSSKHNYTNVVVFVIAYYDIKTLHPFIWRRRGKVLASFHPQNLSQKHVMGLFT